MSATYNPTQPRLLADFAAAPTHAERGGARRYWRAQQVDLFGAPIEHEHQADEPAPCPVCAGPHPEEECPHGTAPTLTLADEHEHQDDEPAPLHRMCEGSGNRTVDGGFCAMWPKCRGVWEGADRAPSHIRTEHEHQDDGATVEQLAELDNVTERLAWSGTTLAEYLAEREHEADEARSTATTLYARMRHEARRDAYADARRAADALTATNQETP